MTDFFNPVTTFLFILSSVTIIRFISNLLFSTFSTPPKKYEFDKYEPIIYVVLISYILTFLIYK
jgi:hypothetical protein